MGRNAASSIMWSHTTDGGATPVHYIIWYCQQHAKYDQLNSSTFSTAFATLKTHIETEHGNAEQ